MISASLEWERFLDEHFPGYLLPESAASALTVEAAAHFLELISGRPDQLALLRAASTLSPRMSMLREFALVALPDLVRRLPARTETTPREWEGGFAGRLDLRGTLAHHLAGRTTRFVTRARTRRFDLPENILVRAVTERLLGLLERLRKAGVLGTSGWGAGAEECEGALRHTLLGTVLREVPDVAVTSFHQGAARNGRIRCYQLASNWYDDLCDGLDSSNESLIAQVVAKGALAPLNPPTRFELAVVVRLVHALWTHVDKAQPGRWTFHRTLVARGRKEVADLERDDGAHMRVFYNQAHFDSGPSELGARHYLGQTGRMRPDVTVITEPPSGPGHAAVVEVKLSSDPDYLLQGLKEAHLYRAEYAPHLTGWPKAILVASGPVPGAPREEHDVIAVSWANWVPAKVVEGLTAGLGLA